MLQLKRLLSLCVLLLGSCNTITVSIPNVTDCSVAGKLSNGGFCAESNTSKITILSYDEYMAFLEPSATKGAAICQSSADYGALKTALDDACRAMGDGCTLEVKAQIKHMEGVLNGF